MIYSKEWPWEVPDGLQDVSEPLKEYRINEDDSLTLMREPWLLGVQVNGKWGWINKSGHFIIPAIYDSGWVLCYNDLLVLTKNGKQGALYMPNLSQVMSFKYDCLKLVYNQTFISIDSNNRCALLRPYDHMLTGYDYTGISVERVGPITSFVKKGLFGITVHGKINLDTGREL